MSKRRVMAKSKIYGFNPWVDQVNAIDQIMEDTGERNESAVLRKLVDEALDARRKKSQSAPLTEKSDDAGARGCTSGKDNDNASSQTGRQMALRVLYPRSLV